MSTDSSGSLQPIPIQFLPSLSNATPADLADLEARTKDFLAGGRSAQEIAQGMTQAGWDGVFAQWFVEVYAQGGQVDLNIQEGTVSYPRSVSLDDGNWWDKQAKPYRKGSWWLYFHLVMCVCPGFIIGLLLMILCKTDEGKENGKRLLIFSAVGFGAWTLFEIILGVIGALQHT